VQGGALRNGGSKSCGCMPSKTNIRHGLSGTRTYMIWAGILQRCNNPKDTAYPYYGGRGITVSPEWFDFANFHKDMGNCPDNWSIERLNCDGPYTKENCKWIPISDQSSNTRRTIKITHNGKTMPLGHWAKEIGVSAQCLYDRRKRGLTGAQLLAPSSWRTS
jgi:hypothetical protein